MTYAQVHNPAGEPPPKKSTTRLLPADPQLERRAVKQLVTIPADILTDPNLGSGVKCVAFALAAMTEGRGHILEAGNEHIGEACGLSGSETQTCLTRLEDAGWITRGAVPPKPKRPRYGGRREYGRISRRRIYLLWKLPDPASGLAVVHAPLPGQQNILFTHDQGEPAQ